MNKQNTIQSVSDFLNDEKFISWRLFRTEELDVYWSVFLSKNPQMEALLDEAIREFDENVKLNDKCISSDAQKHLYKKIETRINTYKRNKVRRILSWTSAAAGVLLIVASVTFFTLKQRNGLLTTQNEIVGTTLSNESVQLIVGNEVVALQSHASIVLSDQGKVSVTDSTSQTKALSLDENKQNRLIVPFGKRSFITLADGTRVWLNSGTEMEFPAKFAGKTRNIRVKGEIYIEVAKSTRPFLIQTTQSTVQVLGTKFNVAAYDDEKTESVVLVEGSVQINNAATKTAVILKPNEKATVSPEKIETETVNVSEYISWRDGVMEFNKTSMSEVLKRVGRYYNVSFESSDVPLNKKTVSGKLFLSNNLDSVMTSVSILSSTNYERENNRIIIRKK